MQILLRSNENTFNQWSASFNLVSEEKNKSHCLKGDMNILENDGILHSLIVVDRSRLGGANACNNFMYSLCSTAAEIGSSNRSIPIPNQLNVNRPYVIVMKNLNCVTFAKRRMLSQSVTTIMKSHDRV